MAKMFENKKNYIVHGKVGEHYSICTCGKTATPPFCSNEHKNANSGAEPHEHVCEKDDPLYICGCGQSKKRPWCDGAHKSCPENDDYMKRW
uniref:Iron-binding zinc finger CDGSH type domain-containing protein n=1 Tax=Magnetococcus massalia (strain MO-1) TaxID=451514 RepID=A0A1S7LEA3_MAGMO|nr:Protein of unknown function. Iron sulphur domain-containing, CDGSH-type [Candidatus Magnetococcus massalia]